LHAAGTTILFITHDMQLVAEYAQEVAVMQRGRVIFQGTPRALFQEPELVQQAYLALPALAELGRRLGHPGLFSVADWLAWVAANATRSRVAEAPS
jgi:energy-coupling factor transport system ATP-binding protein